MFQCQCPASFTHSHCFIFSPPPAVTLPSSLSASSSSPSSLHSSLCNRLLWFPQPDSQWSPSPCSVCSCSGGSVSCTVRPCPPLSCQEGHSPFTPAGECCPQCGRNGGEKPPAGVELLSCCMSSPLHLRLLPPQHKPASLNALQSRCCRGDCTLLLL